MVGNCNSRIPGKPGMEMGGNGEGSRHFSRRLAETELSELRIEDRELRIEDEGEEL